MWSIMEFLTLSKWNFIFLSHEGTVRSDSPLLSSYFGDIEKTSGLEQPQRIRTHRLLVLRYWIFKFLGNITNCDIGWGWGWGWMHDNFSIYSFSLGFTPRSSKPLGFLKFWVLFEIVMLVEFTLFEL